jgi:biopolymer transport protein ExbD
MRRRVLSMTSLIDVIFLLLLFFMLSSTFTRFADLPLVAAAGGQAPPSDQPPAFVRLTPDAVWLDTQMLDLAALPAALTARAPVLVIVAPSEGVTSQQLVDLLAPLRGLAGVTLRVIGG